MNHSALPTYCRSGCGFYGSPATEGLCSKCFKESLKRTNKTADPGISPTSAGKADEAALIVASNNPIASVVAATSAPGDVVVNSRAQEMQTAPICGGQPQGCIEFASSSVGDDQQVGVLANQVCASSISADSSGSSSSTSLAADGEAASALTSADTSAPAKKSNRCDTCRKKTGLTGFPCRCGGLFCSTHRYSDMHGCKFDYKSLGQEEIRKNNPVVEAKKIEKL